MIEISHIVVSLLAIGVTLFGFALRYLINIRDTLVEMSNTLAGLEMWRQEHIKHDDERFENIARRLPHGDWRMP